MAAIPDPNQTPGQQARQALQAQLEQLPGRSHIVENPQGNIAVPTSFEQLGQMGIPTSFDDLASRRFSMETTGQQQPDPLASAAYGPPEIVDVRARTGGTGTVVGIGFKNLAQGVLGLAEMMGVDVLPQVDSLAKSIEEDYKNLDPQVRKATEAQWTSIGPDSVLQNPSAVFYQTMLNLPMTVGTMGIPVARAAIVARAVYTKAIAEGIAEEAARKAAGIAGAKAAGTLGAGAEGTLDVGFTKQGAVDQARTAPIEDLMQVPVFKDYYNQLITSEKYDDPAQAEAEARQYLGQWAIDTAQGNTEALLAGAFTALAAGLGDAYLGKLVGGDVVGGILKKSGKTAAVEGGSEAFQNPQQALLQRQASLPINPNTPPVDVPEQIVQGAAIGAITGAPVGAMSPGERAVAQPPAAAAQPPVATPVQQTGPPTLPPPAAPAGPVAPTATGTAPVTVAPPGEAPPGEPTAPPAPIPEAPPLAAAAPAAPQAVVEPPVETPPVPSSTEQLQTMLANPVDAKAFTDFRAKLVEAKTAAELDLGVTLPPVSTRMGPVQIGNFIDALTAAVEPQRPGAQALIQSVFKGDFAVASDKLDSLIAAIHNPKIEIAKAGTTAESVGSQFARARHKADQYMNAAKGKRVPLGSFAAAVGDMATGLKGLMNEKLSAGVPLEQFPANINKTIQVAQSYAAATEAPAFVRAQVKRAYGRLATMAAQVEALTPPAVAAPPVAPAEPVAPTAAKKVLPIPTKVTKPAATKGEAVKQKVATKKEQKAALNEQLAEAVKKRLVGTKSFAEKHGVLMERPMHEVQKIAAHLGASKESGPTKGERVRAIINKLYPEQSPYMPTTVKAAEPAAAPKTTEAPAAPAKQVEIKVKAKRRAVEKAPGLPALEVKPRVMKQEAKTTAETMGFTNVEDIRQTLGANNELIAQFNKKESPWAWVYGLHDALTPAQNKALDRLRRTYREAESESRAKDAELTIRAFLSNVEGKAVPANVTDSVMVLAQLERSVKQTADLEREADAKSIDTVPGEQTNVFAETLVNAETQEQELKRLISEQEADDTTEIDQELGYGTSIFDESADNTDLNDYELQQQAFAVKQTLGNTIFDKWWLASHKFVKLLEPYAAQMYNDPTKSISLDSVLNTWSANLSSRHVLKPLIESLARLKLNVPVKFLANSEDRAGAYLIGIRNLEGRTFNPNKPSIYDTAARQITIDSNSITPDALRIILHEAIHAATVWGYNEFAEFREQIDALFAEARRQYIERTGSSEIDATGSLYGFQDSWEFMAEALSNPAFQDLLRKMKVPPEMKFSGRLHNLFDVFVQRLKTFFGVKSGDSVLEQVLLTTRRLFMSETQQQKLQGKTPTIGSPLSAGLKLDKQTIENVNQKFSIMATLQKANLGFMDLDVMERKYRALMDRASAVFPTMPSPLKLYHAATQRAEAWARDLGDSTAPIIERVVKLPEQERLKLFQLELDSTLADIHVDLPMSAPENAHLFRKGTATLKKKYAGKVLPLVQRFGALTPEAGQLYTDMKGKLLEAYTRKRQSALHHLAQIYDLNSTETAALLAVKTPADLVAFGNQFALANQNVNELLPVAEKIVDVTSVIGPYFPLRREGDYVVHTLDNDKKAGKLPVVSFYRNQYEANQGLAALQAQGRDATVTYKLGNELLRGDVREVVSNLTSKIRDTDVKKRIQDAMVVLLSDNILYGSSLQRAKIAGVDPMMMGKAFEDYVKSSMSFIGNMESAFDTDRAMTAMNQLQTADLRGLGVSQAEQLEIGLINTELKLRNQELAADRNLGNIEAWIGRVGFLNYLGAPSYWLLNATQTAVVSVPVMAGKMKVSYTRSAIAMRNAYVTLQRATKGKGWKAMMDLDAILTSLNPTQRAVVEQLIKDNIVGSTIAHEFGNLITKTNIPIYTKAVDILQMVPEMVERFNRIATALAAVELGGNYQTAKDMVQSTQFNYSPQNRARLLKYAPVWAGGGGRPFIQAMMMFKVFGVNMARLIYGNMYDAMKGRTPESRRQARRILSGLLVSHSLFGGIYGGLGLGLAEIIGGAINGLFRPEDKVDWGYEIDQFLAQHTNEYVARVITRGAPASVGIDLSSSINLGNLLFMIQDTNLAEPGGIETVLASLMGPTAQYGIGAMREVARYADGQSNMARVLQRTLPIKLLSSLARTYDQGFNGLETANKQQFMQPGEISLTADIIGSLGLRSAAVSQRQQTFYAERNQSRTLEDQKSKLMGSFVNARGPDQMRARIEINRWNNEMLQRGNRTLVITPASLKQSAGGRSKTAKQYAAGQYTVYQ